MVALRIRRFAARATILIALVGSSVIARGQTGQAGRVGQAGQAGQVNAIKAELSATIAPPWNQGIQAINRDNYWNAVACGKQGGARPLCVFWDADLCKNADFTLAMYTPYKQVAYEVWQAVSRKRAAPTPSYSDAQRTRITVGVDPVPGSKNPIKSVVVRRGKTVVQPATQSLDGAVGRFIFDFAAFAPTAAITLEMTGSARTVTCAIDRPVLALFR